MWTFQNSNELNSRSLKSAFCFLQDSMVSLRGSGKRYLANVKMVLMKWTFSQKLFIVADWDFYKLFMKALTVI